MAFWFRIPSRQRFPAEAAEVLRRARPSLAVTVKPGEFMLQVREGEHDHQISLENIYRELAFVPFWRRKGLVRTRFGAYFENPVAGEVSWEDAQRLLMPNIRDRLMLDELELRGLGDPEGVPFQPFAGRLGVFLYLDSPQTMRTVERTLLEAWGKDWDEAYAVALANLRLRSQEPEFEEPMPGLYVSRWGDCFDPARLLLPEILRGLELEGDPVAVCPTWNHLVLTGSRNEASIAQAIAWAIKLTSEDAPKILAPVPLVRQGLEWEPMTLPRGHACFELWQQARNLDRGYAYDVQKQLLDRELAENDVFVGSFQVMESEAGQLTSVGTWSEGVPTWLPETDRVAFRRADGRGQPAEMVALVEWDLVRSLLTGYLRPGDQEPPRFFVEAFPTADEIGRLVEALERRDAREAAPA